MKPIKEKIKGLRYELEFAIPADKLSAKIEAEALEVAKTYKEKGFRPGKVPVAHIKSKFAGELFSRSIDDLVNEIFGAYASEKKLKLATQPKVELGDAPEGKDLPFTVVVEVLPPMPAVDLSKITITKPVAKVGDKEIDESIKNIASSRYTSEPVDRKAKKGDIVLIDFEGFKDGVAFAGGKAENHRLELGSGQFIPGFEDQLVGVKAGDDVEVKVSFPAEYHSSELAGAKAVFKVHVREVREKAVPEINDEFAKELKHENLAKLREYVAKLIDENYAKLSEEAARDSLFDELLKVKLDLPDGLVEGDLDVLMQDQKGDEKALEKKRKELRRESEDRTKLGLLIADLGEKAGIVVEEAELRQAIIAEAMKYRGQEQRVIEWYTKDPSAAQPLRARVFEDKTVKHLLSQVAVKEKSVKPEELTKKAH